MSICKVCQKEFCYSGPKGANYNAVTCSKECRCKLVGIRNASLRIHPRIVTNCEICGSEVVNAIACSKECHGKRLSALYAGRKLTDEWKQNQNNAKTREKIVKYGDYACDKCEKAFETNLSLRAHRSYCTPVKDKTSVSCEICQKTFSSSRGLKIHSHCHDDSWNEPRKDKMRLAAQTRVNQSTSKPEIEFFVNLKNFFGEDKVIHKFKFAGCSHEYDYFIPSKNLIIEFDGDYWHGNKLFHELTPRMMKQYQVDRAWDEKAVEAGYNIRRIWQSDSKNFQLETL